METLQRFSKARRNNRGQTLVLAIMVMFLLALVATIFIALVSRNLLRSERVSNTDSVAQLAEAGIRYADKMLTSSEDGADWRPAPDNLTDPGSGDVQRNNPDFKWTRPYAPTEQSDGSAGPSGGYSTFNTGQGRFLLRVSYNPNPSDPLSKYIKIESIGRWGVVLSDDPTTWTTAGSFNHMRREITAYKPIGITDYLRFYTNKSKRSMDLPLGCPGFKVSLGRDNSSKYGFRGAPIRVNGNLLWYGDASASNAVDLYLRGTTDRNNRTLPIDRVEVAGDINIVDPATTVAVHELAADGSALGGASTAVPVTPSSDSGFTTASGFYRDGRDTTDANNMARGIKRIEPPLVDQPDPSNTSTRYRLLSLNSGERIQLLPSGRWFMRGRYGWGRGVYIGNTSDTQDDSDTLIGGYTVRYDWLKPNNPMSTYWKGPYYVPRGAVIVLHPHDTDGDGQADFTITRTDSLAAGQVRWYDPWGKARPEWGTTITMPYPDSKNGRTLTAARYGSGAAGEQDVKLEGNGVIYAEGNIRIRGMLPQNTQLTVVSNENIYIEGNLLKYRKPGVEKDSNYSKDPWRGADETCGLSLLARKNVVVNTTQFFSPQNTISSDDVASDALNGMPPYHLIVDNKPGGSPRFDYEFGPYESETGSGLSVLNLLLRHAGQYGSAYIYTAMNRGNDGSDSRGILTLGAGSALPDFVYGVGDPFYTAPGWGVDTAFACDVFPLTSAGAYFSDWSGGWSTSPILGLPNTFEVALYPSRAYRNYLLGGFALQPMDVRIEAVIYAQEGSFFVIPGGWFNPDTSDLPGGNRPAGIDPVFPYFGQPLDIRVIIDGAVSENLPAAISDVEDWMSKWGSIPDKYGSSNTDTTHPGEGLTFLYDDHAGWPLSNIRSSSPVPIRTDKFGRTLPITPRLPVSSSLIYFGDIM